VVIIIATTGPPLLLGTWERVFKVPKEIVWGPSLIRDLRTLWKCI